MHRLLRSSLPVLRGAACAAMALCAVACSPQTKDSKPAPQDVWNSTTPPAYDYPFQNPYAATVIALPPKMALDYSAVPKIDEKELTVFPDRKIPEGFWYERGLHYGQLLQPHPAPLVYVIAGTGASFKSDEMKTLANVLYTAGFHVVLLPSPTHQNFIINASTNYIVGRPQQSSQDLYRVMLMIDRDVTQNATVTKRMLTGYSLGALDAAFTGTLDEERHQLNFSRVLLINPPLNLYNSITIISKMLYYGLPHGMDDADGFVKQVLLRLHSLKQSGDPLDFQNERMLIGDYDKYKPDNAKLASTIGLSFRLSAASVAFTSDVMSHSGYVFPKDKEFTTDTDLTRSMSLSLRTSFVDYFNEFYVQKLQALYPGMTKQQMVDEASLTAIAPKLQGNPKYGLITNRDDIILAPGEVDTLAAMFSPNAYIFRNGGHVGNLAHPTVDYDIVHFLRGAP